MACIYGQLTSLVIIIDAFFVFSYIFANFLGSENFSSDFVSSGFLLLYVCEVWPYGGSLYHIASSVKYLGSVLSGYFNAISSMN